MSATSTSSYKVPATFAGTIDKILITGDGLRRPPRRWHIEMLAVEGRRPNRARRNPLEGSMDNQNSPRSLLTMLAALAFVLTGGCADEHLCLLFIPPPTTLTFTLDHQLPVAEDTFEVLISNPYSSTSCVVGGASGTAVCDGDVVASASWSASEIVVIMESPFYDRDRSREVHPPESVEVLVSRQGEEIASLTVGVAAGPTLEPNGRGCGSKWMATAYGQVP